MVGWSFPLNNWGQETGLNDAGIETFLGNPWRSLAREVLQNSCDARQPGSGKPVGVHFKLYHLPLEEFPDKDGFIATLKRCRSYWQGNSKTRQFFNRALQIMKQPQIPVLRISDYNTIGLKGSDQDHGTDWYNLIKSVGTSDKNLVSGGSFGIGKHAPFACSGIRTIFYGTKDFDGKQAFQGVAKLVTHRIGEETTQGTGYYGKQHQNRPLVLYPTINDMFERTEIGTDVYVAGFNAEAGWEARIIKSVLDSFFLAILTESLVVKVESTAINSNTIPTLIEEYIDNDPDYNLVGKYYKTLTSPDRRWMVNEDFEGMGRLELNLLAEKDYPKKVAMVRATGMKIYDKGHFHTPLKFAGVLVATGDKLNEFLRSLEPLSHNDWEYQRHEDPRYAREILVKLKRWLNEQVRSITISEEVDVLDIEGLSQYLPDDLDDYTPIDPDDPTEGEKGSPKKVDIEIVERKVGVASREAAATEDGGGGGGTDTPGPDHPPGTRRPRRPCPKKRRNQGGGHDGDEPGKVHKPLQLKYRTFCLDSTSGLYSVAFETQSDGEGFLTLKIVGEDGNDPAPITKASVSGSGEQLGVSGHQIGPITFEAGVRQKLLVVLDESLSCALEVSAHAS